MHELGLRYPQGISLLLSSAVPEGKGVSSSAAVEVAVMQALCAAHDLHIDGRHLALLCQKVSTKGFRVQGSGFTIPQTLGTSFEELSSCFRGQGAGLCVNCTRLAHGNIVEELGSCLLGFKELAHM